jgi:hypothetical protein
VTGNTAHVSCGLDLVRADRAVHPTLPGVVPIMNARPRVSLLVAALSLAAACGPRQVEVRTAPTAATQGQQSVQVTNNLSQAVNVYVTASGGSASGGNELFLRQVPANTVEKIPVQNVPSGSTVTFKAVTVDGSRTYQSRSAPLSGLFVWSVP